MPSRRKTKRFRPASGFTLLEVLVALAVAAVLFLAVGALLNQQLATGAVLEKKAAAAQLGWNLVELNRLEKGVEKAQYTEGRGVMGDYSFSWKRRVSPAGETGLSLLELQVSGEEGVLFEQRLFMEPE